MKSGRAVCRKHCRRIERPAKAGDVFRDASLEQLHVLR